VLTGEPGVRKPALLSAAAERAVARGVRVIVIRANRAEYVRPGVHASGISRDTPNEWRSISIYR
jgi:hypothetical protein